MSRDGKYVASCAVHSTPIVSFIEPVEQKDTRIRGCIVSVAEDNSVALISVDSMSWYVFCLCLHKKLIVFYNKFVYIPWISSPINSNSMENNRGLLGPWL